MLANRQHRTTKQRNKQTNKQTNKQNKQKEKQADPRRSDRLHAEHALEIATHSHSDAVQRVQTQLVTNGQNVDKRLRGVLMLPVAGVDDRDRRAGGGLLRGVFLVAVGGGGSGDARGWRQRWAVT